MSFPELLLEYGVVPESLVALAFYVGSVSVASEKVQEIMQLDGDKRLAVVWSSCQPLDAAAGPTTDVNIIPRTCMGSCCVQPITLSSLDDIAFKAGPLTLGWIRHTAPSRLR